MKIPTEGPFRYAGTHMLCSVRSIIVKLSYTDAKELHKLPKLVMIVFQKCAKAACMCGVTNVNVSFHIRLILSNTLMNGVNRSLRLLV